MGSVKPFIKWVGGKTSLVDVILPQLLATGCKTLVSPFLGGGAIELAWLEAVPDGSLIAGDANWQLVATWNAVRDSVEGVITRLDAMRTRQANIHNIAAGPEVDAYYAARAAYNVMTQDTDIEDVAAMFIFLNKTAFNGLYRVNSKGGFNAPFGKRAFTFVPDVLRDVSRLLNEREVSIVCRDFERTMAAPSWACSTVTYADPPYLNVFSSYTKDGFTEADHVSLADCLTVMSTVSKVFASNSIHAYDIYASRGFNVEKLYARRRVSCAGNRDDAEEILASL